MLPNKRGRGRKKMLERENESWENQDGKKQKKGEEKQILWKTERV